MKKIKIFYMTALVIMVCFMTTSALGEVTAQLT
ncbi:MAG TPA: nitrite reductase, copper-containing, partial [Nitrospinaceae bacterium]|nr:nitrite reductase, copper-containing [Nitrospinaceae bacterium]